MKNGLPDPALIESMAMRYRHDFMLLSEDEKEPIRTQMLQIWEEVAGLGFYQYPDGADVLGGSAEDPAFLFAVWLRQAGKHEITKISVRDAFMLGASMAYTNFRHRKDLIP